MSGWLSTIKTALKGEETDFTEMNLKRAIVLLAIPMILEMAMESLFAVVDAFFVGKVGKGALATIGFTESILTLVYALAFGLAMATTAIVARRWGEKNYRGAASSSGTAIMLGITLALGLGGLGYAYSEEILLLMGAEKTVIENGLGYTQIMFASQVLIMLLFLNNGIFRGAGNAAAAMKSLWLANGINIVLDPCFIHGWWFFPELGVTGAAVATTIGRGTGVVFQLWLLFFASKSIRLHLVDLGFDWNLIRRLVKVASGAAGQFLIASASWIFLMRIMSEFGTAVVDGYTASIRVIIFAILPAWGMANASATLVGQNLGAKHPERAAASAWHTARYAMVFLFGVALLMLAFAPQILALFSQDPETIRVGALCLRIIAGGYPFFAYGLVLTQAFNGAGDTRTPTLLNFLCFWLLQIPLAYLMAIPFGWEEMGVYIAVVISETVLAVACIKVFRQGKWKLVQV